MVASDEGYLDVMKNLIEAGADVNQASKVKVGNYAIFVLL